MSVRLLYSFFMKESSLDSSVCLLQDATEKIDEIESERNQVKNENASLKSEISRVKSFICCLFFSFFLSSFNI